MLTSFLSPLRAAQLKVSVKESVRLLAGLRAGLAAGIASTLLLGGCALLPGTEEPPSKKEAEAAGVPVERSYHLVVDAPTGEQRKLLITHLDLARFQHTSQADAITPDELARLANAAPGQAKTLLETEGYFGAQAVISRSEAEDGLPQFDMKVTPGPRTLVTQLQVRAEGELLTLAEAGDPGAKQLLAQLSERWTLPPGEPFRQAAWVSAKNNALARLRAEGYPTGAWLDTEARIDPASQTATLSGTLRSGPRFLLGEMRVEGLSRYNDQAIRNLADFQPGTPYTEKKLLDYQDRLVKLGLFENVSVEIDPNPELAAATPVTVKVREQTMQQTTTGIGYSDRTRLHGTLEHRHRRPFGWEGQAYNKFELGDIRRFWKGELISDPTRNRYRNLLASSVTREKAAGEVTTASSVRAGRSLDTEHIERLIYGELLGNTRKGGVYDEKGILVATFIERAEAISLNYNWVWRDLDSVILPTRGLTSSIQVGAGQAQSNFDDSGPFARVYTRNTLYWPLGKSWYSQVRVEGGRVFAQAQVGMPDALLFRAGGDESVRGYGYRTLGPQKKTALANGRTLITTNALASGRTLFTTSAEIAHPFTQRIPNLWWAAFVDAGDAANKLSELRPALGYGLGLRFRSPVGPLRVDVAYGERIRKARMHLSVGIAF